MAGETAAGSLVIRPARDNEWPACRMLVPEAFGTRVRPDVLLAFEASGVRILGAAAYSKEKGGIALKRIRVLRTHRRQRIGSALLEHIVESAPLEQRKSVSADIDALAEPEAAHFLRAGGFVCMSRMHVLEVELEPMRAGMQKLFERAQRSGRVPESARIVHPSEAPTAELARIFEEQILAHRRMHPALVEASITEERFEYPSSVLLVDGHVAAMLMVCYDMENRRALVPARAVEAGFRGGIANVWVMADALEKGRRAGITRVRFEAVEDNSDTRKLARRFGGDTVHIYERYMRATGAV